MVVSMKMVVSITIVLLIIMGLSMTTVVLITMVALHYGVNGHVSVVKRLVRLPRY